MNEVRNYMASIAIGEANGCSKIGQRRRVRRDPFNPETSIRFDVPHTSRVRIQVYDARGRLVKTLVDDALPAGRHEVSWRGRSESGEAVASGIYFITMEAGSFRQTRKITLLK